MSLSTDQPLPMGTPFDPAFETLAQTALQRGLLLIAAAGNAADLNQFGQHTGVRNNPPAPVGFPANCPSVLAVGALMLVNADLQIAPFSNGGQADPSNGVINFAAPGFNVVSTGRQISPFPRASRFRALPARSPWTLAQAWRPRTSPGLPRCSPRS